MAMLSVSYQHFWLHLSTPACLRQNHHVLRPKSAGRTPYICRYSPSQQANLRGFSTILILIRPTRGFSRLTGGEGQDGRRQAGGVPNVARDGRARNAADDARAQNGGRQHASRVHVRHEILGHVLGQGVAVG